MVQVLHNHAQVLFYVYVLLLCLYLPTCLLDWKLEQTSIVY
jgi:hypothetical protein